MKGPVGVPLALGGTLAVAIGDAEEVELGVGIEGTAVAEDVTEGAPGVSVGTAGVSVALAVALASEDPVAALETEGDEELLGNRPVGLGEFCALPEAVSLPLAARAPPAEAVASAVLRAVTEALPLAAALEESEGEGETETVSTEVRVAPAEREGVRLSRGQALTESEESCVGEAEAQMVGEGEGASLAEPPTVRVARILLLPPPLLALPDLEGDAVEEAVAREAEAVNEGEPEPVDAGESVGGVLREAMTVKFALRVAPGEDEGVVEGAGERVEEVEEDREEVEDTEPDRAVVRVGVAQFEGDCRAEAVVESL